MKKFNLLFITILFLHVSLMSCRDTARQSDNKESNSNKQKNKTTTMEVSKKSFGSTTNGKEVNAFLLKNSNSMEVEIIEYGAIVSTIKIKNSKGKFIDVVLGYDDVSGYENDPYYFGGTIGRVANRTSGAQFTLDGVTYKLAPNTLPDFGHNHLHGGVKGFNKRLWKGVPFKNDKEVGVTLTYLSPDGEEGYPGNVKAKVTYTLNNNNELGIVMEATTDKPTFVNMTHHSYFNLSGAGSGNVLNTSIQIDADKYTPADDDLMPTGEISEVKGLPVDFTTPHTIGSRLDQMQMAKFKGYDLNYVVNHTKKGELDHAARATDKASGVELNVFTTQPCMHFYTSNFLEGKPGKDGKTYNQYGAFCFEPQGYPDAPNKLQFESVELKPGETYKQTFIYKFSTVK